MTSKGRPPLKRREFLRLGALAAGVAGFPAIIPSRALGKDGVVAPSNRVAVGVIGCGARSASCGEYVTYERSEIVAVCDPVRDRRLTRATSWGVTDDYADFREVLGREDIDAVHIVTQDHWHVPIALAAARAGKDIYCEKPLGISIEQDLAARQIVDEHQRVFQYGTQQRSMAACRMGIELVLNGHIGDVKAVYVWAPPGESGGDATPTDVPEGFDYDLWLGPAPGVPFSKDRVSHKGSWYIYDYALGFIAGWGAHPLDLLQWWADEENLGVPVAYEATGMIPTEGLFDTATHWQVECSYANGLKVHFLDTESARKPASVVPFKETGPIKPGNGTLFMGTRGWVCVSRGTFSASSEAIRLRAREPGPRRLPVSTNHFRNFIDSVLKREQPVATLHSGVRSDIISQMGDIGIRTGESLKWDPVKETVMGSCDAVAMMHRPMREPWSLSSV